MTPGEDSSPMMRVSDALSLAPFARARLVAGKAGLDRTLQSVHVVDLPDAAYDWGREGVLLLTSGAGLDGDVDALVELVSRLAGQGLAGMVLSLGYAYDEVPQAARETADALAFPMLETPADVMFLDLSEAVYAELARRQHALLEQSAAIHERLTAVVLAGGDLQRLAVALADLLRRSVTIEDVALRVLATAVQGAVDEARQRSVARGQTSPELAERLMASGLYERLRHTKAPERVAPMPDLGMTMERIVAPVVVGDEVHGYFWIIAGDAPLTDLDEVAIRHGATVAALIKLTEQARRDAADALRNDLLEDLLARADPAAVAEHAHRLGVRADRPHQVLLVHASLPAGSGPRALGDAVTTWAGQAARRGFTAWRQDGLVWVLEADDEATGRAVAAQLVDDLGHPARRLLVGIGEVADPGDGGALDLRRSYAQAREALAIARALGRHEGVVAFSDLGLLHWLHLLPPQALADNAYAQRVRLLAAEDAKRGTELVRTLELYLEHEGPLAAVAAALHVHRNTLLHRLRRIEQRCAVDLRDPETRLQLHAAVKAVRLRDRDARKPGV